MAEPAAQPVTPAPEVEEPSSTPAPAEEGAPTPEAPEGM